MKTPEQKSIIIDEKIYQMGLTIDWTPDGSQ